MWHAACLTPMFSRPRRYVDLFANAQLQRHKSPNIKNRRSVLFAPFSFTLKEKGDRSRDIREKRCRDNAAFLSAHNKNPPA